MEARLVDALPEGPGWQFEPKWDGFRCVAYRSGDMVDMRAKSGKPLGRYFPEMLDAIRSLPGSDFIVDGELVIPQGDTLSFDALQMRLHPAESRIRKLAHETPSVFILFDLLRVGRSRDLMHKPLARRRAELERLFTKIDKAAPFRLSPFTRERDEAEAWLQRAGGALDGVMAKRIDRPYESGERAMLKVKRMRTADCVVGGFRYGSDSPLVGSLLLGLFDSQGLLDHVGFTSTILAEDREPLTRKLEALKGPPGFTGRAPGGPSRWSTERSGEWEPLRHELVVEVRYDQVTGDRFRHGTKLLRWRPDKAPGQCTFDQLEREARPGKLIGEAIEMRA
ncbi:ATP-dependent DNA ligase [Mesorhizobium sp. BAC0120]|nr:ATP-dependent DNA ligase [Mesorhizobium sp. BAC0120]MDW6022251.1 ATP-dependent DNA ligase [Mesorhizobium sp. BAC0120]